MGLSIKVEGRNFFYIVPSTLELQDHRRRSDGLDDGDGLLQGYS